MGTLERKVAIVSGCGRGIGREIAIKLASEGAQVVVNDVDADPAAETIAAIEAAGGKAVLSLSSRVAWTSAFLSCLRSKIE